MLRLIRLDAPDVDVDAFRVAYLRYLRARWRHDPEAFLRLIERATGGADLTVTDDFGVERALRRWEAWETNLLLPEALQPPRDRPRRRRAALDALQRLLAEELARPDGSGTGEAERRRASPAAGALR